MKYYEDPWLHLRGRLLDGTTYDLTVIERFQVRSRWKRGRSGKMKHKTKTKSATVVVLRLKPKAAKHAYLQRLASDARNAVQLPGWVQLRDLGVADGLLVLKVGTKTVWSVPDHPNKPSKRGQAPKTEVPHNGQQMTAMMFLSLYQVLNLSRAISKGQRKV